MLAHTLFDLPYATHKYFYEAITTTQHAALIIKKRFVNFVEMIRKSNKVAPKMLLQHVENVRSVREGGGVSEGQLSLSIFFLFLMP